MGVQLRQAPSERQKYVIAVQLQDNPYNGVPAGVYKDRVSVDIIFKENGYAVFIILVQDFICDSWTFYL